MISDINKYPPFEFKTKPLDHQLRVWDESKDKPYYAVFWEMGLGKSKLMIDTIVWLYLNQEIDGAIIVGDKGNYMNWVHEEIPKHISDTIDHRIGYFSSSLTTKQLDQLLDVMTAKDDVLDFLLINVDSLHTFKGNRVCNQFIDTHYCLMCVDESTSIKNYKAKRTKEAIKLGARCDYRRIMTGTPIEQSPLDLFGQCEFLKKNIFGHGSFVSFRAQYAEMVTVTMGRRMFQKINRFINLDRLKEVIKPWSSRLLKTECVNLPDKIYTTKYIEQTLEQRKAYNQLKDEAVYMFDNSEVTITSALTLLMKLHQINCGHLIDDDGNLNEIRTNRPQALLDIIEEIGSHKKIIIWCWFQHDVVTLKKLLLGAYGPGAAVTYYGPNSDEQRKLALELFEKDSQCRFFIGTPRCGGKGLTLVQSAHTIYYSQSYRLGDRLQSEDRNHRIGQNDNVIYTDIVVPGTVDEKVVKALRAKKNIADYVLDDVIDIIGD